MNKGGLVLKKKEMTKLWVDGKFTPVTLLKIVDQEVVRHKTSENDGYDALVVGAEKKALDKVKGIKEKFGHMTEFKVTPALFDTFPKGSELKLSALEGVDFLTIRGVSKGKGYQGVVKRFHFRGGCETHGSKFHRLPGSIGNRKPRRVDKGHPLPGHMGTDTITLKNIKILERYTIDGEDLIAVKGSIPGFYNGYIKAEIN